MNIQSCVCVTPWVWRGFYWIQGTLYEIADQTYCQDTVLELCWQHWKWEITQISIWEEDNQQCNLSVRAYLVHIRVTIDYFSISKHKTNTTEVHPKVRQTCCFETFKMCFQKGRTYIQTTHHMYVCKKIIKCPEVSCGIYLPLRPSSCGLVGGGPGRPPTNGPIHLSSEQFSMNSQFWIPLTSNIQSAAVKI